MPEREVTKLMRNGKSLTHRGLSEIELNRWLPIESPVIAAVRVMRIVDPASAIDNYASSLRNLDRINGQCSIPVRTQKLRCNRLRARCAPSFWQICV